MPRGGKRENAGRKVDENSKRSQKAARKAVKDKGFTASNGDKKTNAPENWPFGTDPALVAAAAPKDPEKDDGLTDAERAGLNPLEYLLAIMRSPSASKSARMNAAVQAAPYVHARVAPAAKKQEAAGKAKNAAKGRFGVRAAPLKLVGGG